jgi:chromosome segregation ATPase
MTQWLKRGSATVGAQGLPRLGRDGLLEGVAPDTPDLPSDRPDGQVRRLSKQELREQALARLEDGHLHLVKLVETIRQHLESQDRQGQAIVQSLEDIGGHLSRVSQSVNKQTETLGAMSAQVQASGERTRRLEEALAGWPALAESQRATLTLLAEQIGAERQSVDRIGESVQAYGGALSSLERSTTDAVVTVRSLHGASMRVEEQLAAIGRRQTKWLVLLFGATAAVAVLAAVLTLVALFR